MEIKVGADPELFITTDEGFHSAHGIIPGTKVEPHPVKGGAVQVDGMALEFNVEPATQLGPFITHVEQVMEQLREMVPPKYAFSNSAVAHFTMAHLKKQPKEAILLGCEPDYNAYNHTMNPPVRNMGGVRVAGGHVHVGWTKGADPFEHTHFMACANLTTQLDYFLGVPSTILDKDKTRRKYYGQAGAFRPKPYGLEYRVLSNFWIYDRRLIEFVFSQVYNAVNALVDQKMNYYARYGSVASEILAGRYPPPDVIKWLSHQQDLVGDFMNLLGIEETKRPNHPPERFERGEERVQPIRHAPRLRGMAPPPHWADPPDDLLEPPEDELEEVEEEEL